MFSSDSMKLKIVINTSCEVSFYAFIFAESKDNEQKTCYQA